MLRSGKSRQISWLVLSMAMLMNVEMLHYVSFSKECTCFGNEYQYSTEDFIFQLVYNDDS